MKGMESAMVALPAHLHSNQLVLFAAHRKESVRTHKHVLGRRRFAQGTLNLRQPCALALQDHARTTDIVLEVLQHAHLVSERVEPRAVLLAVLVKLMADVPVTVLPARRLSNQLVLSVRYQEAHVNLIVLAQATMKHVLLRGDRQRSNVQTLEEPVKMTGTALETLLSAT